MKVVLLKKMVGATGFFPAGSVIDVPDAVARILIANRHAQPTGSEKPPIPLPNPPEVKNG